MTGVQTCALPISIEWAEKIGVQQVVAVLEAIHSDVREERYRIAPLLRQLATGNKWWQG